MIDGGLRGICIIKCSVEARHDLFHCIDRRIAEGENLFHPEFTGRDSAGLICANDICSRERLNRRHFLDKRLFSSQPSDAYNEGYGSKKDQSFRNHSDHTGDGANDGRVGVTAVRDKLAAEQQDSDRNQSDRDHFDDAADGPLHLGLGAFLVGCLADELGCVTILADFFDLHDCCAGGDKTSREDRIPVRLLHRFGFAGQHGFIDFESLTVVDGTVRHDLISGFEIYNIVQDNIVYGDLIFCSAPKDHYFGRRDDAQLVDQALDLQLLNDTDQSIGDRCAEEENILDLPRHHYENAEEAVQKVEVCEYVGGDNLAYGLLSLAGHLVRQTFLSAPGNLVFRESGSYDFFALTGIGFVNADDFRRLGLFVLSMQKVKKVGLALFDRCGSVRKVVFFLKVVYGFFIKRVDFAVPVIILVVFREIFVVGEFRVYIVVLCFLFFHI